MRTYIAKLLHDIIKISCNIQDEKVGVVTHNYEKKSTKIDDIYFIFGESESFPSESLDKHIKQYTDQVNQNHTKFLTECLLLLQNSLLKFKENLSILNLSSTIKEINKNFEDLQNKYSNNYQYICIELANSLKNY
ncbi:hypothetical protein AB837_00513 [bacterium AB1]|nr:hypothetical protein AB837_00513 [bacterium AB1]